MVGFVEPCFRLLVGAFMCHYDTQEGGLRPSRVPMMTVGDCSMASYVSEVGELILHYAFLRSAYSTGSSVALSWQVKTYLTSTSVWLEVSNWY